MSRSGKGAHASVAVHAHPDNGRDRRHKADDPTRSGERIRITAAAALLTVLSIPYFIALWSPLRLSPDAIGYLSVARAFATHGRYEPGISQPIGYPWLLSLLDRVGLGSAWAFVAMNILFLAIGLIASYVLFRRSFSCSRASALLACCAILLTHDVIAVAASPMSDATFFGTAALCVGLLEWSMLLRGVRMLIVIGTATALAAGALEIRTIGIALWPALLFTCVSHPEIRPRLRRTIRDRHAVTGTIAAVLLAALGAAAYAAVSATRYEQTIRRDGWTGFEWHAQKQLRTLGELAANAQSSMAHVPAAVDPLFGPFGIVLIGMIAIGVWRRRRFAVPDVFALSTAAVLIVWSLPTPRLWIPAVPVLIGYVLIGARTLARVRIARIVFALYVFVFAAAGVAMLGNSVRLSLSGPEFADLWARRDPVLQATYQVAYGQATIASIGAIEPDALLLLRCYDPHASAVHQQDNSIQSKDREGEPIDLQSDISNSSKTGRSAGAC